MRMSLSAAGAAFLFCLAVACDSPEPEIARDGASSADGASTTDGARAPDSASTTDGGGASDSTTATDMRSQTDVGSRSDSPPMSAEPPVNLGMAGSYVILAKSGISTVPPSVVTGDLGISPSFAADITEFSLVLDNSGVFASSSQVTGSVFAADYAPPTESQLTTAVIDMDLAFTDAAGRAPDHTELHEGNLSGRTLNPGVYRWATPVIIKTDVTLSGGATDVWIFQIGQTLTVANTVRVFLSGGARAENIFWQVSEVVDIGTSAHMEGVILGKTAITMKTSSSINGRLLAQTAVTLQSTTVTQPTP
jgi:hypothetical protein